MVETKSTIRPLCTCDSAEVKALYDSCFSKLPMYYGHNLDTQYLDCRVFSSALYSTDQSLVQIGDDGLIKACVLANLRRNPEQAVSDSLYLNLLVVESGYAGMAGGRQLISKLFEDAKALGKRRVVTSLQWCGIWPGVISVDTQTYDIYRGTGMATLEGEIFVQSDIRQLDQNLSRCGSQDTTGVAIRSYAREDGAVLQSLLTEHFSYGWRCEVLNKVGLCDESFNGYGLAQTYKPDDVIVVVKGRDIVGFCVVQSGKRGCKSFLGPIGLIPTLRGRGLGTRLFHSAVEYLRDRGKTTVGLWTSESIHRGFYARFGMEVSMRSIHFEWMVK